MYNYDPVLFRIKKNTSFSSLNERNIYSRYLSLGTSTFTKKQANSGMQEVWLFWRNPFINILFLFPHKNWTTTQKGHFPWSKGEFVYQHLMKVMERETYPSGFLSLIDRSCNLWATIVTLEYNFVQSFLFYSGRFYSNSSFKLITFCL